MCTINTSYLTCVKFNREPILFFNYFLHQIEFVPLSFLIWYLPITYSPLWSGLPHLFFHNKACHILSQTFLVFQHTVRPSPMSTQHLILISQLIMALITGLQILWKNVTSCMKGHAFHTYYDKASLPRSNPVFMKISRICSSMRQKYIQI